MAEAMLRRKLGDRAQVLSAGTEPADGIHPLAVEVMEEAGYDLSQQEPKHFRQFLGHAPIHTLVIVCDGAAKTCPAVWPGAFQRLMWPFEDPAAATGDREARKAKFREVRDALAAKVDAWDGL